MSQRTRGNGSIGAAGDRLVGEWGSGLPCVQAEQVTSYGLIVWEQSLTAKENLYVKVHWWYNLFCPCRETISQGSVQTETHREQDLLATGLLETEREACLTGHQGEAPAQPCTGGGWAALSSKCSRR